jgi:HupF/HypC family protein
MKVENFFLRYAYPCAYIILQRGNITSEKLKELEDIAINNKEVSRKELEKIFFRAFEFIDEIAKQRNKDRWDPEVIKSYFYEDHNKIIENKRGTYAKFPEVLRKLSRVEKAIVVGKKEEILTVKYRDEKRNVFDHFVPEVKIGDIVTIHYGYAIEIVDSE